MKCIEREMSTDKLNSLPSYVSHEDTMEECGVDI